MINCEICGKEFETQDACNGHKRVHKADAKYRCYFCGGRVELYDRDRNLVKYKKGMANKAVYARCAKEGVWWEMEEFGRLTVREK